MVVVRRRRKRARDPVLTESELANGTKKNIIQGLYLFVFNLKQFYFILQSSHRRKEEKGRLAQNVSTILRMIQLILAFTPVLSIGTFVL